jgi:GT2 family glycosyltransferase
MEPPPRPLVTIAIASKEDEARIDSCLRCALAQDYPKDRLEIIVADAMSMDATRELVLSTAEVDPRIRLIDNPDRTRAAALNAVVKAGRGEIIVPFDPGADYAKSHVSKCVDALSTTHAEHVAIAPRTAGRTFRERALSAVQSTRLAFAAGADLARGADAVPAVIGAVRRRVFAQVGLFDPGTKCEEDVELARRISKAGGTLTLRRDIVVHKADSKSFKDLFKHHFVLGRSRARRTVKERSVGSIRDLAPLALVLGGGALFMTSSVQPITPLAVAAYALVTGAAAVRIGRSEGIITIPIAWAAYPVMHVAHGVGFGAGVVRAVLKPDWDAAPALEEDSSASGTPAPT